MRLLAVLLLLFPCAVRAGDWELIDRQLAATALVATTMDWAQTRTIAKNPQQFYEMNPLLGRHPSMGDVNRHFVGAIAIGTVVAFSLPKTERRWFLGGAAALEIGVVAHNLSVGIRMDF